MLLPESAIVFDREGTYVWRVKGDVPERVPVGLGVRKAGRVEVALGLQPGDTVVVAGTHKVSEGKPVQVAVPGSTGQARRSPTDAKRSGEGT